MERAKGPLSRWKTRRKFKATKEGYVLWYVEVFPRDFFCMLCFFILVDYNYISETRSNFFFVFWENYNNQFVQTVSYMLLVVVFQ